MLSLPLVLSSLARCPCVFLQHPGLLCFSAALITLLCNFWLTYSWLNQWPKQETFLFLTRLSAIQISIYLCGHALPGLWALASDPMKETWLSQLIREAPFLWWWLVKTLAYKAVMNNETTKRSQGESFGKDFFSTLKEKKILHFCTRHSYLHLLHGALINILRSWEQVQKKKNHQHLKMSKSKDGKDSLSYWVIWTFHLRFKPAGLWFSSQLYAF